MSANVTVKMSGPKNQKLSRSFGSGRPAEQPEDQEDRGERSEETAWLSYGSRSHCQLK